MAQLESFGTLDKVSELHSMTKTQKTVEEGMFISFQYAIIFVIVIHLGLVQHCLAQHLFPNSTVFNWFKISSYSTVFSHFYHS